MNKNISIVLVLAVAAQPVLGFVVARNGSGNPRRWDLVTLNPAVSTNVVNRTTRAVRYFLAADGWSTTNAAAELNGVRASFAQWQAVSGTILKFEDAGTATNNIDASNADGRNLIFWTKTNNLVSGGTVDMSGFIGLTFSSSSSDGTLGDVDIVFNGYTNLPGSSIPTNRWFTDFNNPNSNEQFVESVATHEIGHFIGLAHSPVGAATMLWRGTRGVDVQAGLSSDDIAGARFIYMATNQVNARATLKGQVTKGGVGILGAAVTVEDAVTNVIAGTVSRGGGNYEMNALPPGAYRVRVSPLDPSTASRFFARGPDISSEFNAADTSFLPSAGTSVTLSAGATNTLNLSVVNSSPAFRITNVRFPTTDPFFYQTISLPAAIVAGQTGITVGVASTNLPTSNATLTITGDGLTMTAPTFGSNLFGNGQNYISTVVNVATNATPGMRSFIVQQGTNVAYANGFLEIRSPIPDFNFDGLDDTFQRKWFPLFTATNAAPASDPDGDGVPNSTENIAGTNPTNAASLLKIDSIRQDVTGARVTWRSVPGKSYQLLFRSPVTAAGWTAVGTPVLASTVSTNKLDPAGTATNRFYRVQVLP